MACHIYYHFEYQPKQYQGPLVEEVIEKRRRFLGPSLFYYYQKPLNIVEGKMQYLYDEKGRKYLDAFTKIVTISYGHCHPHVLEAITEQTKLLQHAKTIYLHHAIADVAKALAAKMPRNLKGVRNGLPLGAIVTTPEMTSVMAQKIQFNTLGGNLVCSIGGLAVLRVINQEKHQDHCTTVGSHLLGRLRDLQ